MGASMGPTPSFTTARGCCLIKIWGNWKLNNARFICMPGKYKIEVVNHAYVY